MCKQIYLLRTSMRVKRQRIGHGKMDWFKIGKEVRQGYILSPCLFNFYAEYIMRNTGRKKHKLESRLPGEMSITSDMQMTPPLRRKQRGTKDLLDEVKEESGKAGLKLNIQKAKIMAFGPITSWQTDGETVRDFILGGNRITADGDCSHDIERLLLFGRKVMTNLDSILKSRDITNKVLSMQGYGFSSGHVWM